jgi:seryl-tRNA synthetase
MLDLRYVEENEAAVRAMLKARGVDFDLGAVLALACRRRELIAAVETKRAAHNQANEAIARAKKARENAAAAVAAAGELAAEIKELDARRDAAEAELRAKLLYLPNLYHPSVPVGESEEDNAERARWGEPRVFDFPPRPHWEVGELLGITDVARAVKVAGARFVNTVGAGARLERALMNFMLEEARARGYVEVNVPYMVLGDAMTGTGQLPKFADDLYKAEAEDLWLIPTAEVPVTNLQRGEILATEDLPKNYAAFTPCFRREAGAPGRDTRGLMRVHQFLKVELVKLVKPEDSYDELEALVRDAAAILEKLALPYREVVLCTADLGFGAAKCVDLEVWLPSENKYREISSCSNYEAFQARRMNTRYRPAKGAKPAFIHTLNGSALALGRTLVAILENYQHKDGTVDIPEVLRDDMGGSRIVGPNEVA